MWERSSSPYYFSALFSDIKCDSEFNKSVSLQGMAPMQDTDAKKKNVEKKKEALLPCRKLQQSLVHKAG